MTLEECRQEKAQLDLIQGIQAAKTGFICSGGFAFTDPNGFILLSGEQLYQ
jgi:hypothetical protein